MMHKAWCSIEEVPYYFSKSYIKFQDHTGWKIDDLDQIWARLLGRSQLSNPSDLPCCLCDYLSDTTRILMTVLCAHGIHMHILLFILIINNGNSIPDGHLFWTKNTQYSEYITHKHNTWGDLSVWTLFTMSSYFKTVYCAMSPNYILLIYIRHAYHWLGLHFP